MTDQSGLTWLRSLQRFGIKPGLERTIRVLDGLNHPEQTLRFLHIAGTNGKGSVCANLTSLFSQTMRVGTFTSPSFDGYRARFEVAGEQITEYALEQFAIQVRSAWQYTIPSEPLTEFEALTLIALLFFQQQGAQVVVWETGLGGRYDSTNIVLPEVTAITNVSYDHIDILGPTLRHIAINKAGIAKPGVPMVTAAQDVGLRVIERAVAAKGSPLWVKGKEFDGTGWVNNQGEQIFTYRGHDFDLVGLTLPLFGPHQVENATVALAVYEAARQERRVPELTPTQLRSGMEQVRWPGRFERFWMGEVPVVLDGAHNEEGARRLAQSLIEYGQQLNIHGGWVMVTGILQDKRAMEMMRWILPLARVVICTAPAISRAEAPEVLAAEAGLLTSAPLRIVSGVAEAMDEALHYRSPVCCWGSLYTVNEARQAINQT